MLLLLSQSPTESDPAARHTTQDQTSWACRTRNPPRRALHLSDRIRRNSGRKTPPDSFFPYAFSGISATGSLPPQWWYEKHCSSEARSFRLPVRISTLFGDDIAQHLCEKLVSLRHTQGLTTSRTLAGKPDRRRELAELRAEQLATCERQFLHPLCGEGKRTNAPASRASPGDPHRQSPGPNLIAFCRSRSAARPQPPECPETGRSRETSTVTCPASGSRSQTCHASDQDNCGTRSVAGTLTPLSVFLEKCLQRTGLRCWPSAAGEDVRPLLTAPIVGRRCPPSNKESGTAGAYWVKPSGCRREGDMCPDFRVRRRLNIRPCQTLFPVHVGD